MHARGMRGAGVISKAIRRSITLLFAAMTTSMIRQDKTRTPEHKLLDGLHASDVHLWR